MVSRQFENVSPIGTLSDRHIQFIVVGVGYLVEPSNGKNPYLAMSIATSSRSPKTCVI